jgi:predicted DNA binding protein
VPTNESGPLYLLFKYMKVSEKNNILAGSDKSNVISDIMNVPYRNPVYANINQVGRMWIYRYTLALCKEIEGQIRATFQNTAVGAVVVNGSELLTDARTEKADLLAELKEMLNEVSRRSQLEKKQAESEFTRQTMNQIPLLIYSL